MNRTRALFALLVIPLFAPAAVAQSAEFGRGSGGSIDVITKAPRRFSGSLSLTRSTTRSTGTLGGNGYEGSLGGALLDDRVWFFAAASTLTAIDTKLTAQPVDWTSVTASFAKTLQPVDWTHDGSLPASFLSLRSTSVLSDRTMLNFSFSRSTTDH